MDNGYVTLTMVDKASTVAWNATLRRIDAEYAVKDALALDADSLVRTAALDAADAELRRARREELQAVAHRDELLAAYNAIPVAENDAAVMLAGFARDAMARDAMAATLASAFPANYTPATVAEMPKGFDASEYGLAIAEESRNGGGTVATHYGFDGKWYVYAVLYTNGRETYQFAGGRARTLAAMRHAADKALLYVAGRGMLPVTREPLENQPV